MLKSHLDFNFDVLDAATNNRYTDNDDIRLVNLGSAGLLSKYKLTTSSGRHLEDIEHVHTACLMYNLLTTARGWDDLSIGFDGSRDRRQREKSNNENIKGKYDVRIYLSIFLDLPNVKKKVHTGLVTNWR